MATNSTQPGPGFQVDSKELHDIQEHRANSLDDITSLPSEQRPVRGVRERLGNWSIIMLTASTFAIVLVVAFLAMLWQFGWDPNTDNKLARAIASANWMIKATTLSAVLMRLAVAVQAGVCTSLAAALLLEGKGVPQTDVLHFAALRSLNTGPPMILFPITRRFKFYMRSLPALVIVLIFLTTTACQLASTILVSDFAIGTMEGPRMDIRGLLGTDVDNTLTQYSRSTNIDYWGSRPNVYPAFGERSEPSHPGNQFHDTGATFQGMIPFQNATARDIRLFEGFTNIFGSRVACVAPNIEATVQYHPRSNYRYLVGNATLPKSTENFLFCNGSDDDTTDPKTVDYFPDTCTISFNCTIPYPDLWSPANFSDPSGHSAGSEDHSPVPVAEWYMGICAVKAGVKWGFDKSLSGKPYEGAEDVSFGRTDITMILNFTEPLTQPSSAPQSHNSTRTIFNTAASTTGEWATYSLHSDGTVDLSLCFAELDSSTDRVSMSSSFDTYEAVTTWNDEHRTYDTSELRTRFNTSGSARDNYERGVLDMRTIPMEVGWNASDIPYSNAVEFASTIDTDLYKYSKPGRAGTYIPVCTLCSGILDEFSIKVHPVTTSLFYDIVTSTRHPALGLQAIFNTLVQSAYYEELPSYSVGMPVKIRRTIYAEYPYRWLGFMVVVIMLVVHLALVGVMVGLFAKRTRESLIGELWHSVGMVMGDCPEGMLGRTEREIRGREGQEKIVRGKGD